MFHLAEITRKEIITFFSAFLLFIYGELTNTLLYLILIFFVETSVTGYINVKKKNNKVINEILSFFKRAFFFTFMIMISVGMDEFLSAGGKVRTGLLFFLFVSESFRFLVGCLLYTSPSPRDS